MPGMTRSSSFYGLGTRTCLSRRTCRTKPQNKSARKALADICPRFGVVYFPVTWSSLPQQLVLNSKKVKCISVATSQGLISFFGVPLWCRELSRASGREPRRNRKVRRRPKKHQAERTKTTVGECKIHFCNDFLWTQDKDLFLIPWEVMI